MRLHPSPPRKTPTWMLPPKQRPPVEAQFIPRTPPGFAERSSGTSEFTAGDFGGTDLPFFDFDPSLAALLHR